MSTPAPALTPRATRPHIPHYGISTDAKGLLPWSHVTQRMTDSKSYWICTSRPDSRPHAMPVWGFWLDDAFYFGTHSETRKGRNLAANPAVVVHLESGDDAVILEGTARQVAVEGALRKSLDAASRAKYKMPLFTPPGSVVYTLVPRVAFAWRERDFPQSATRFLFSPK